MLECLIVGDSIAVGTAMYRPECVSYSRGGWNSWQWNRDYLPVASSKPTKTLIISLGANDHQGVKTEAELRKMREAIVATQVFWISPGHVPNLTRQAMTAQFYRQDAFPAPNLTRPAPNLTQPWTKLQ